MENILANFYTKFHRPKFLRGAKQSGMTLIEIIIVVALLGTLITYLVSSLTTASDGAKVDQAKIGMGGVGQALQLYRIHHGRYPTSEEGLGALLSNPGSSSSWRGPYTEKNKLKDPWQRPFEYKSLNNGRAYEISSEGLDSPIYYPERDEESGDGGSE